MACRGLVAHRYDADATASRQAPPGLLKVVRLPMRPTRLAIAILLLIALALSVRYTGMRPASASQEAPPAANP